MNHTGISFQKGAALSSSYLNIMNDKINELVDALNKIQKDHINVNIEFIGTTESSMTLETALSLVPMERRIPGVTIKFNDSSKETWSSYTWDGSDWNDTNAWICESNGSDIIDGGSEDVY